MTFLHRLALKLGIWDVDALAEAMPVDLLYRWMAYYQLEPWGDEWLRSAVSFAQFRNVHKKKSDRMYTAQDFMPVAKRQQTPQQMLAVLNSIPLAR
jgi:hypothetical protein